MVQVFRGLNEKRFRISTSQLNTFLKELALSVALTFFLGTADEQLSTATINKITVSLFILLPLI